MSTIFPPVRGKRSVFADDATVASGIGATAAAVSPAILTRPCGSAPAATVMYSLQRVRPAYRGNALRLRRSSDNAEADFGFVGRNLDSFAITAWLGGATGYVKTWYDQSGNGNNATQTTTANQPTLVLNGMNSKPTINFTTNQFLVVGQVSALNITPGVGSLSVWLVAKLGTGATGAIIGKAGSTTTNRNWYLFSDTTGDRLSTYTGGHQALYTGVDVYRNARVLNYDIATTGATVQMNGTAVGTDNAIGSGTTTSDVLIGARRSSETNTGSAFYLEGKLSEVVIFPTILAAATKRRVGKNICSAWGITHQPDGRDTVVFLGASHEKAGYPVATMQTLFDNSLGRLTTCYNEATDGWTTLDLRNNIATILATYSGKAYIYLSIGGNDVSTGRPYATDANKATQSANLEYILSAITSAGNKSLVVADLTFRDYDNTTHTTEANGSKPYNDNLIVPLFQQYAPSYVYATGVAKAQLYKLLFDNYATYLSADTIHPNATGYAAMRTQVVNTVWNLAFNQVEPVQQ